MGNTEYLEYNLQIARKKYTFARTRLEQINELLNDETLMPEQKISIICEITEQMDRLLPINDSDYEPEYSMEELAYDISENAPNESIMIQADEYTRNKTQKM